MTPSKSGAKKQTPISVFPIHIKVEASFYGNRLIESSRFAENEPSMLHDILGIFRRCSYGVEIRIFNFNRSIADGIADERHLFTVAAKHPVALLSINLCL